MFSARTFTLAMAALALAGLAAGQTAHAQSTISTVPAWNGTDYEYPFGNPNTTTYGQTITATAAAANLQDFTFYLAPYAGTAPTLNAYVAAWDGTKITGPLLYSSGDVIGPTTGGDTVGGFTPYTFTPGGVALTPGQQYALFISTANHYSASNQQDILGAVYNNPYAGGAFIYDNVGANFNALSTAAWTGTGNNSSFSSHDLAFKADFGPNASAAPEPSQFAGLSFAALAVLGLVLKARRKTALAQSA